VKRPMSDIWRFEGEREEDELYGKTDDKTLRILARAIKTTKKRQRLSIVCPW